MILCYDYRITSVLVVFCSHTLGTTVYRGEQSPLGVIGIFLPILPTTPFLLLAAACYARSSKRFYDWLMNNKIFGSFVKNYRDGRGVPLKVKVFTLSLLWITIVFSVFVININSLVKIILVIIAFGVSVHILTIKTYQ